MKILSAAEMREVDRRSADEFGVSRGQLMRAAGRAVATFAQQNFTRLRGVCVLCGTGDNGGDGIVAADQLARDGVYVNLVMLGSRDKLSPEARHELSTCGTRGLHMIRCEGDELTVEARDAINDAEVIIDAVVGTGFKPPLRGLAVAVREVVRTAKAPVFAVDLPSGSDADSAEERSKEAFRADAVVTFTAPKTAHIFGHLTAPNVFGPVVVAPIGSPDEAIVAASRMTWTGASLPLLHVPRPIDSNKGMYGHVLVCGGADGKAGAPAMAALAALRSGAGLVTVAVPRTIQAVVAGYAPELMTLPLQATEAGGIRASNAGTEERERMLHRIDVLAIGPGLGTEDEAAAFTRALVTETKLPVVIDADGLNAFNGRADLLQGHGRTMVLTPHPGEMATLLGVTTKEVQNDRLNLARKFATEHGVTLVLKGWRTLVAHPDGRVAVNTSGNPGMAKGGSGDILTGIVAACIAQHPDRVFDAVNAAVYLHGLAGDFATQAQDEHTVLATDTLAHLGNAFRYRTKDATGAEWITGLRRGRTND